MTVDTQTARACVQALEAIRAGHVVNLRPLPCDARLRVCLFLVAFMRWRVVPHSRTVWS